MYSSFTFSQHQTRSQKVIISNERLTKYILNNKNSQIEDEKLQSCLLPALKDLAKLNYRNFVVIPIAFD